MATHRGDGAVEINPVVGVRSQKVEQLVSELSGRNQRNRFLPTVSTNVGYVMPQQSYYRQLFRSGVDIKIGTGELADVVSTFGVPFMRQNANLEVLSESMERHIGWPDIISYSLPVAYLLLGHAERAEEYVKRRLAKLEETPSPATDQYRQFANRVGTERIVSNSRRVNDNG
jgi:hypothetical protein